MTKERRIVFDLSDLALRVRCTNCNTAVIVHVYSQPPYPPEQCPSCRNEWADRSTDRNRITFRNIMETVNIVHNEQPYPVELKFEVQA